MFCGCGAARLTLGYLGKQSERREVADDEVRSELRV